MTDDPALVLVDDAEDQEKPGQEMEEDQSRDPVAGLGAELAQAREALVEREGEVARLAEGLAQAEEELEQRAQRIEGLEEELRQTLARYRSALLEASPDVPPELVQGEDVEALELSLAQAREMVLRIRRQLEAQVAAERVPTGAPTRSAPNLSSLSAREKIVRALSSL